MLSAPTLLASRTNFRSQNVIAPRRKRASRIVRKFKFREASASTKGVRTARLIRKSDVAACASSWYSKVRLREQIKQNIYLSKHQNADCCYWLPHRMRINISVQARAYKSSPGTGLNLSAFLLLASRGKHAADLHLESCVCFWCYRK